MTLTATGGTGTVGSVSLTISQLGTGPNVVIGAPTGEDFLALPAAGGTIVADVALTGGADNWDAVAGVANPGDFLTVEMKDVANKMQPIAYALNEGVARPGTVTFTTSGGTGTPAVRTFDFMQLGAAPTIDVSTSEPDYHDVLPASPRGGGTTGTITATITIWAGVLTGWTVEKLRLRMRAMRFITKVLRQRMEIGRNLTCLRLRISREYGCGKERKADD